MRTSLPSLQQPERHHDQPAQQHRCQQILHAVLHHQRHDHHRHRPGRTGDHPRSPAEQRGEGANDESPIKPHQRIEMCHQREGDAFGQQGERRGEPGQGIGAQMFGFMGDRIQGAKRVCGCYGIEDGPASLYVFENAFASKPAPTFEPDSH
jgi:hypothetical protein